MEGQRRAMRSRQMTGGGVRGNGLTSAGASFRVLNLSLWVATPDRVHQSVKGVACPALLPH